MSAFVRYTVLRLGLFVAALALFALLGARGLLLVVLAAFASLALSYVMLRGPRAELSQTISGRMEGPRRRGRVERRIAEDAEAEDAEAEDVEAGRPPVEGPRADGTRPPPA
jgi:hypothetical protein